MARRDNPSRVDSVPDATTEFSLAVSPYHLCTRELSATVALMLADRVVTIVPEPAEGRSRDDIREVFERVPRLLRVLEAWRWSAPLWRGGLIAGKAGTDRAFASVDDVGAIAAADPALRRLGDACVRPLEPGEAADHWLDGLCSDLLRGGPDPALSTVITGALDRFAAANGFVAVRGSTDSLAQRAESKLMQRSFSIAIPVMSRAAGGRILLLREALQSEFVTLRSAMCEVWQGAGRDGGQAAARLQLAAKVYSDAFESWFAHASRDDENAERTMRAFVSLTGALIPIDSALVCARSAMRNVARAAGRPAPGATATVSAAPELRAIMIRPMNVRPV